MESIWSLRFHLFLTDQCVDCPQPSDEAGGSEPRAGAGAAGAAGAAEAAGAAGAAGAAAGRKAVVVTARVHPGETNSSWMMLGFLQFVTGPSPEAKVRNCGKVKVTSPRSKWHCLGQGIQGTQELGT